MVSGKFGEYLKSLIEKEQITKQDFYNKVGIGKPYFYEILSGKVCPPPPEVQMRMTDALRSASAEEKTKLLDLASVERDEIPADIARLIKNNPSDLNAVRKILNALLVSRTIKLN